MMETLAVESTSLAPIIGNLLVGLYLVRQVAGAGVVPVAAVDARVDG